MMTARKTAKSGSRGTAMVLAVGGIAFVLAGIGLSVDLGMAFISRAKLYKAVDAGALAGARDASAGWPAMQALAEQVANANFSSGDVEYTVSIDEPTLDAVRVSIGAEMDRPTYLVRVFGADSVEIRASAEATRFPLDMSLVLDRSLSLALQGATEDLRDAAQAFLERFDEDRDQIGITTYATTATEAMPLQKNFLGAGSAAIANMHTETYNNMEEGVRLGTEQLVAAPPRPDALGILVLLTDGRPTAFRDVFDVLHPPGTYDGVIAALNSDNWIAGLFHPSTAQKIVMFQPDGSPLLMPNWWPLPSLHLPTELPGNLMVTGENVRRVAVSQAEGEAQLARAAGYTIFCIGLGNIEALHEWDMPDMVLLERIANQDGVSDPTEPRGEALYADETSDLDAIFTDLADRILVRLTR